MYQPPSHTSGKPHWGKRFIDGIGLAILLTALVFAIFNTAEEKAPLT